MLEAKHSVSIYQFSQNVGTKQIKLASINMKILSLLAEYCSSSSSNPRPNRHRLKTVNYGTLPARLQ